MKNHFFLTIIVLTCLIAACTKKNATPKPVTDNTKDAHSLALTGIDSPFVTLDSANKMINSYLGSLVTSGNNDIKSFTIDADALRYYLQNSNIKRIRISFAHKLSYINAGHKGAYAGMSPNAITLIISGISSDNNYIYTPDNTVMDHAFPCPYNCIDNGTAASDNLPQ